METSMEEDKKQRRTTTKEKSNAHTPRREGDTTLTGLLPHMQSKEASEKGHVKKEETTTLISTYDLMCWNTKVEPLLQFSSIRPHACHSTFSPYLSLSFSISIRSINGLPFFYPIFITYSPKSNLK